MIGHLRGLVIERHGAGDTAVELVVDVGGVGYRVLVSPRLGAAVVPGDGEVALAVHTHVREGAITLYGFATSAERQTFELLLGAHGVGPALALAIVSVHGPDRLPEIVGAGDVDALTLVPGVGKKTATRLLVELKARFDQLGVGGGATIVLAGPGAPSVTTDVSEALVQLGYSPDEVRTVLRALPNEGTAEELLRHALRELAPRR
ncbi:MAG: Holliday junction branch migration protein RuvA [Acidimicrobiales bacterium]